MKIRFEITVEDILNFTYFDFRFSPAYGHHLRICIWSGPGFILIFTATLFLLYVGYGADIHNAMTVGKFFILLNVVVAIPLFLFMRFWMFYELMSNARRSLSNESNLNRVGWHEMELSVNQLIVQTALIETRVDLRAIVKITKEGRYTFVYTAPAQAFIIPMDRYPEVESRQFVANLTQAWEDRDVPPPPAEELSNQSTDAHIVERPV